MVLPSSWTVEDGFDLRTEIFFNQGTLGVGKKRSSFEEFKDKRRTVVNRGVCWFVDLEQPRLVSNSFCSQG